MTTPGVANPSSTQSSASRPRVVVAGHGSLAARVASVAGGDATVVAVPGALAALAELARHRDSRALNNGHAYPPTRANGYAGGNAHAALADRVVIHGDCLHGIEGTTLATLQELGAADHLVLVDPPEALNGRAHDYRLSMDAEPDAWRHALALGGQAIAPIREVLDAQGDASHADPIVVEPTAATEPTLEDPIDPHGPEAVRLDPRQGDAELVQAILDIGAEGGHRAPRIALGIAEQRAGIADLAFTVHQRGEVPAGHASAVVAFRGETFGSLHAPAESSDRAGLADRLQPWADWLARWIALDQQARRLRDMAMKDPLTGVWNRRYFDRFLARLIDRAGHDRRQVTLMVFDIDNFKQYNDAHGHAAGDEILAATAKLMLSVVRDHDVVARIGGDEFAVIFWDAESPREEGSTHPDDVANIAKRFQRAVCDLRFPALARSDMETLTISGGLAGFPWDGRTSAELLHHADLMALESKRKGKNALTFGAGALRCELP